MTGHFYYADHGNEILITNDAGRHCFLSKEDFHAFISNALSPESNAFQLLKDKLFLFDDSSESYIRRMEEPLREANRCLFDSTNLFIFALTNECNNRCVYCQANGSSKSCQMTPDVAEQALQQIALCPSNRITIEFQGGEPLMNYATLEYIVKRSKVIFENKDVQLTLVSNLSLLTDDMACFFKENEVSVSTSLDGPSYLHDLNRPAASGASSYEATMKGVQLLRNHGIVPGAIETTTAQSLNKPEAIVDTYVENGFDQIFLRPLTRLGAAARSWDQIGYTPEQFLDFYRRSLKRIIQLNLNGIHIAEYHASLFLAKILAGRFANYMELRSPCGAGLGQMAFTANGNVYTCDEGRMMAEMGDEAFKLGNVFTGSYKQWIESSCCKSVCSASLLDTLPRCYDCVYKPYCGVCPVVNYAIDGNITHVNADRCQIFKGIMNILFEYIRGNNPDIMNIFADWSERG